MRKHAYLILAHENFGLLRRLLSELDDARNDIYIHFDKKSKNIPSFTLSNAELIILNNRIDVRWGDVSMIEAEYALFETALKAKTCYSYYHLLSGVDMPVKNQAEIHDFFKNHEGYEFIGFSQGNLYPEIERKICIYHFFSRHYRAPKKVLPLMMRVFRTLFTSIQLASPFRRYNLAHFKKGPQWISITENFVEYLILRKGSVLKRYRFSFCADELFVQSECYNSVFYDRVFNKSDPNLGSRRITNWKNNEVHYWTSEDIDMLVASEALFARKFSSNDLSAVDKLTAILKSE